MGTRNTKQRAIRQEALREQLSKQKHLEHVVDLVKKIKDEDVHVDQEMLARYKIVIDTKMKLIGKFLPDLKATELTGEGGGPVDVDHIHDLSDKALERLINDAEQD